MSPSRRSPPSSRRPLLRLSPSRPPPGGAPGPPAGDVAIQTQPAVQSAAAPEAQPVEAPAAGGRFHIVQAGESLWSIAADSLSPRASTAAVALQVHRLWKLNEDRI